MPSRCHSFVTAIGLTALVLGAPMALAQVGPLVPAFTTSAEPNAADVYANASIAFNITVHNPAAVDRNATLTLPPTLPAGWTYGFSRDSLAIPAKSNAHSILTFYVPATASAGNLTIAYEVKDELSEATRANVTVRVVDRPAAPAPAPQPVAEPAIRLATSTGDSAKSGETAQGTLTIVSEDARSLTLAISIASSGDWSASIPAADRNRVLAPGASTNARLEVRVPDLAENETRELDVTVRATVAGASKIFTLRWSVLGIAAERAVFDPTAPADGGDAPAGSTGTTSSGSGRAGIPPRTGPNLDVFVEPLEVSVPSASEETVRVRLVNTGGQPLVVTLAGDPPATWRPFTFLPATPVAIPVGGSAEVLMTISAPDVPPGGTTSARVYALDGDLVRQAQFVIRTVPGAPVDRSETATVEAPTAPEGSLPVARPSVLVVVGLAAVGSAAAIVVSRPLREKLLWGAAGLYTRLARPDVLGHEDRERLYKLVETQPGIHFHALQRDLGWNTGTLTYHVRVLERHGFVVSRRDGLYRRFYLSGAAPRKEVFENQGPTGLRADVIEAIKNAPGISQTDLALGLGANKQTVNYHVKALERAGTIRVEKRGRDTFLYPGGAAPAAERAES